MVGLAVAGLVMGGAACSSSSGPSGKALPTPTPTFSQLGTLAISNVVDQHSYRSTGCPAPSDAFPQARPGETVACDLRHRTVYLLAEPTADERDVDATTLGREPHGAGWSVYLQLTSRGAKAVEAGATKTGYAIVYNGAVVEVAAVAGGATGGLIQVAGLSKQKAHRIARALNPS